MERRRCPDGAGDDCNPSLYGLGLKIQKDPPVPRRLVGPGQIPPNLSPAYINTSSSVSGPSLASKFGKIRTGPQAGFRLCRLPVRPERRQGQTHPKPVADTKNKNQRLVNWTDLSSPATDVPHRAINSNRKAGRPRQTPYEAHTMASQKKTGGSQNH